MPCKHCCAGLAPFAQLSRLRRCPGRGGFRQVVVIQHSGDPECVTQILGTCARLHLWCCQYSALNSVSSTPAAPFRQMRQHGPLMLACTVLPCDFWETYHGRGRRGGMHAFTRAGPHTLRLTRLCWRSPCLDCRAPANLSAPFFLVILKFVSSTAFLLFSR